MGAGSSFGIITSIELKTQKLYSNPVTYTYQWNQPDLQHSIQAFENFQSFGLHSAPPELSVRFRMGLPNSMFFQGKFVFLFLFIFELRCHLIDSNRLDLCVYMGTYGECVCF